jgi:nitrate reductase assembly molybdenum cofactor insertion protein NarJ
MSVLRDRAREFALASALAAYPDDELVETLRQLSPSLDAHPHAGRFVHALAEDGGLDELRSSYVDLFDRGPARISLYETEYGRMRGLSKGNDLADISGFYRAFGLAPNESDTHEMLDHIAVELEFYAILLAKQDYLSDEGDVEGTEIVEDARRKFLEAHLGPLAIAVAARFPSPERPPHGDILVWCGELVAEECEALAVKPIPLDFFAEDEDGRSPMSCGSVRLPVLS